MSLSDIKFGILTVSDRCSNGTAIDSSGTALKSLILQAGCSHNIVYQCVPDEIDSIKEVFKTWENKVDVIITTGGTGFSSRDVTPEATQAFISRRCDALALAVTGSVGCPSSPPTACLSRAVAGIAGTTLIVNLPGSEKAVRECWTRLVTVLPHAVKVIKNDVQAVQQVHEAKSKVLETVASNRDRKSPWPMISVEEAEVLIETAMPGPVFMEVPLKESLGRIGPNTVVSKVSLPPFRASTMDGYAVLIPIKIGNYEVIGAYCAGSSPLSKTLAPGQCVRVSTGGPVPPGENVAVVPVEDTTLVTADAMGNEVVITILSEDFKPGKFIREIGSDMACGQELLKPGMTIDPSAIAILASANVTSVRTFKPPVVGVMSTGDELTQIGSQIQSDNHCIFDCNRPALLALFQQERFPAVDLGICPDRPNEIMNHLQRAQTVCDVIITTGGVSMGEKDYLKRVLTKDFNATIHFGRIKMKPGKPTTFATWGGNRVLFALPGNPVSAMVTAHLFVVPALRRMIGCVPSKQPIVPVEVLEDIKLDPRPEYKRVSITQDVKEGVLQPPKASIIGEQISSRVLSLGQANGLLILPAAGENGVTLIKAHSKCDALLIGSINIS